LPGIGLIFLRIAVASGAIAQGLSAFAASDVPAFVAWATGSLAVILGLALLIGFLTPLASAAATSLESGGHVGVVGLAWPWRRFA
jgi:uncharacterized membrane protein YphA (DoxX/SURF4 family)